MCCITTKWRLEFAAKEMKLAEEGGNTTGTEKKNENQID